MLRIERCALFSVLALTACGAAGAGEDAGENPATGITPPPATTTSTSDVEWTLPTGTYRAEPPDEGSLELHIGDDGTFELYDVTDGSPDLGFAAACAADDASTVTCTERSGTSLVFTWAATEDTLEFTVVEGDAGDRRVWEGAPWIRVP